MESPTCRLRHARHVQGPEDRPLTPAPVAGRPPDRRPGTPPLGRRAACSRDRIDAVVQFRPAALAVSGASLLLFPLVAMYMVARQRRRGAPREPILFNAYLFWLTSGFMGLHRMYLKSWWGFVYLPFFVAVLYCNGEVRDSREDVSRTTAGLEQAQTGRQVARSRSTRPRRRRGAQGARRCAGRRGASTRAELDAAGAGPGPTGRAIAGWIAVVVAGAAARRRRAAARPGAASAARKPPRPATPPTRCAHEPEVPPQGTAEDPTLRMHTPFTDWIDRVNAKAGEYVAYWARDRGVRLLLRGARRASSSTRRPTGSTRACS